jgi:hypothetical protein
MVNSSSVGFWFGFATKPSYKDTAATGRGVPPGRRGAPTDLVGGVDSPLVKTPGPSLVRASLSGQSFILENRFSGEANPVSTVATSRVEGAVVRRIVGRFVMTRFRRWCLLGES